MKHKTSLPRIAFVTAGVLPVPPTRGGAVENLVYNILLKNEVSNNFQFDVFTIPYEPSIINDDFKNTNFLTIENKKDFLSKAKIPFFLKFINNKFISYPFFSNALKRIRNHDYDFIIVENRPEFVLALRKEKPTTKIILHLHNDYLSKKNITNERIISACDLIVVVSGFIRKTITSVWGETADKKCKVLYNGVDDFFINALKEECTKSFKVVFHGRVSPDKGVDLLVESLASLCNQNIELKIIGGSWYDEGIKSVFFDRMKETISNFNVNVSFTGYLSYEQIPNELSSADLIVLPSVWDDPFPLVVLEAMAAKKVLVTTFSGGIPEAVGETAILLRKDVDRNVMIKELSAIILKIYSKPDDYENFAERAYERYQKNFTVEHMYHNFIETIKSLE
jgi:spore coat protein SA